MREGVAHEILNAKNHEREGEIVAEAGEMGRVTVATNMAGRGVDIKLGGLPFDEDKYEEVKKIGGLFVLGTERHEARRIDNQLRGRSGRQGDPGETQFFVSMEDSLMRVFASDTVKKMMGHLGIPEDQAIENKMVSRSLESAQTKIEGFHFDSRKHILQYDDVLNHQRKTVYERRRVILIGDEGKVSEKLEEILETKPNDEIKLIIKNKEEQIGKENFINVVRRIILQTIDMFWVNHLEAMDYLRSSVNLRAYGQRDPLVEYRREGLKLFQEMQGLVNDQILRLIPNIAEDAFIRSHTEKKMEEVHDQAKSLTQDKQSGNVSGVKSEKIGRNDPCPCGAKKPDGSPVKYKHCCGKN